MKIVVYQVDPYRHNDGEINYAVSIMLNDGGMFCNSNAGFKNKSDVYLWLDGAQVMAALLGFSTTVEFQDIRT
jgi:hypothetical protein